MENQLPVASHLETAGSEPSGDTIDWLHAGLVDNALCRQTAVQQDMKQNTSQYPPLSNPNSQHVPVGMIPEQSIQQQQALQALQTHAFVNPNDNLGWPDFSPRSINLQEPTNPVGIGQAAVTIAAIKRLQQQNSQMQSAMELAAGQAQAGLVGFGLGHAPYMLTQAAAAAQVGALPALPQTSTPTGALPNGIPFQLPPLPTKAKRGRGAPKKAAKLGVSSNGSRGVTKKGEGASAKKSATSSAPVTTEEKRRIRAERNRESAEKSRLRRKKYTDDLEKEVDSLRETNKTLKTRSLDLMTMLHNTDADVERAIANGEARVSDAPNGGAALKAALLALENMKQQCPITFGAQCSRVPNVRVRNTSTAGRRRPFSGEGHDTAGEFDE